jgi:crotonobetainyl-CoA:carnitine CoA-transferase CaiB-like acyl-CoA transferase
MGPELAAQVQGRGEEVFKRLGDALETRVVDDALGRLEHARRALLHCPPRMGAAGHVLEGIRVLDVGSFIAGPAAATVMSDFGAEVIKVEPPGAGDPYRDLVNLPGMPLSEINYPWLLDSRNKKSVALDLTVPDGREVLLTLARSADVFLTNFGPAVQSRLKLSYEDLAAVNPRLVYAALTGYGEAGEEANKPGFDVNAWWARSGLMELVRAPDALPASSMPGMGDHPSAMALFGAIMLGLYRRERTGRGCKVSSSLMANGAWANSVLIQAMLCGATFVPRPPRGQALNALVNFYQCRDGRWIIFTLLREEREWERFTRAIGCPELAADPRFATTAARHANSVALVAILDEVFTTRDWAEWREVLESHEITFGLVCRLDDVAGDRQMAAAGLFPALEGVGLRTVTSPVEIAGEPKVAPRRAPRLGEHTDEVLRAAGYDDAALARLRALGAIG